MRLLDRYLFRELLIPLGFCLGGFMVFWIAFDLFGRVDEFQEWRLRGWEIGLYYLYGFPELLNTALPVALLLAMLYALTTHARHNELIAMRAAGLSLWRICLPYFGLGLFLSLVLLAINERLLVDAPERRNELTRLHAQQDLNDSGKWKERVNFWNPAARRDWSLGAFHLETAEIRQPRVNMPLPIREGGVDQVRWTNGFLARLTGSNGCSRMLEDPSGGKAGNRSSEAGNGGESPRFLNGPGRGSSNPTRWWR